MAETLKKGLDNNVNYSIPNDYDCTNIKHFKKELKNLVDTGGFHLIFMGTVGSGKTHLARSIMKHIDKRFGELDMRSNVDIFDLTPKKVVYKRAPEIYKQYLNGLKDDKQFYDLIGENKDDFLLLDDIGAETPRTDASRSFIGSLLEERHEQIIRNKCTATIITTNLTVSEIADIYGARVESRLYESFTFAIFGKHDFRKPKGVLWSE